jgi:hypothetical protein
VVAGRANSIETGLVGDDFDKEPGAVGACANRLDVFDGCHGIAFADVFCRVLTCLGDKQSLPALVVSVKVHTGQGCSLYKEKLGFSTASGCG